MKEFKLLLVLLPIAYALFGYLLLLENFFGIGITMFGFSIIFGMLAIGLLAKNEQ